MAFLLHVQAAAVLLNADSGFTAADIKDNKLAALSSHSCLYTVVKMYLVHLCPRDGRVIKT